MPEYGRVIQSMVDHCLTIEDRDERTRCAYSIIKAMKILFHPDKNEEDAERTFWDHLAMMSDFKLDIDWPYEIVQPDAMATVPEPVPYDQNNTNDRSYGHTLLQLIDATSQMQPSPDRDALIVLIANQMKKVSLSWDNDGATDERIFSDLATLSNGQIVVQPGQIMLCDYVDAPKPGKKKKKK